jgi:hypothetical protein
MGLYVPMGTCYPHKEVSVLVYITTKSRIQDGIRNFFVCILQKCLSLSPLKNE